MPLVAKNFGPLKNLVPLTWVELSRRTSRTQTIEMSLQASDAVGVMRGCD
jgi:hypothetical protein